MRQTKKIRWLSILFGILLIPFVFFINEAYKEGVIKWRGFQQETISLTPVHPTRIHPSWLYYEVVPGELVQDEFWLVNKYRKEMEVTLGVADATGTYEDPQSFSMVEDSKMYHEVGRWLTFDNAIDLSNKIIPQKSAEKIPFTLQIPEELEEGYYMGLIYAVYTAPEQKISNINIKYQLGLRTIIYVTSEPRSAEELAPKFSLHSYKSYFLFSGIITLLIGFIILFSQTNLFPKRFRNK